MAKSKVDIEPGSFDSIGSISFKAEKPALLMSGCDSASEMIGQIMIGVQVFGFTKGQFSFSDVLEHVLNEIGPAELMLSTWTASQQGLERAFDFLKNSKITGVKFLIDRGFKQFKGKPYDYLMETFGQDCIRTSRIHAKFAVLRNYKYNVVIRTSMNLNKNLRLENFEITENLEFAEFFQNFFDEAFSKIRVEENFQLSSSQKLDTIFSDNQVSNASAKKKRYKF